MLHETQREIGMGRCNNAHTRLFLVYKLSPSVCVCVCSGAGRLANELSRLTKVYFYFVTFLFRALVYTFLLTFRPILLWITSHPFAKT
jgi:hypothetical protein